MDDHDSELTRRYLLNSHSRGSLEEVASEDDLIGICTDFNESQMDNMDETSRYLRQAYE